MRTLAESNLTRCAHVYKKYSARINCMKEKRLKRRNMTTQLSISPQRCRNVSFRALSSTKFQIPRLVEETLDTSLFTTKCRKEEVLDMIQTAKCYPFKKWDTSPDETQETSPCTTTSSVRLENLIRILTQHTVECRIKEATATQAIHQ